MGPAISPFVLRRINQLGRDFDEADDTGKAVEIARAMARMIDRLSEEDDDES